ncbi:hypothetical protein BAUCODRAFT_255005 [Baudoinia panamericana UAMH 10762]|uniref:Uncharacterized protein n=1 Tax=Baudoinia panamericana (strain UAMH 10762) TaxID=717646 RepID=M2LF03_BAUPA|nr:uncharacterized protein BAUCODRAFT_255005 [Baudoinia panamericana UAMH 10762]EMC92597.1 hypothetical protein BAUCODRAFT_255005 [Baudoinia panamericana UAMH 10762]
MWLATSRCLFHGTADGSAHGRPNSPRLCQRQRVRCFAMLVTVCTNSAGALLVRSISHRRYVFQNLRAARVKHDKGRNDSRKASK